jgi:hypothetical protein
MRRFTACAVVSLALAGSASAQSTGIPIADYQDDFTTSGPAPTGWTYYRSTTLGDASQYIPLTRDVSGNFTNAAGGTGNLAATPTSLTPGLGATQNNGTPQYVISAYTVQPGDLADGNAGLLDNYRFAVPLTSADGISAAIYVNNNLIIPIPVLPPGIDYNRSLPDAYPVPLGNLSVGDTVYVAIGAGPTDTGDVLTVDYSIFVPEPGSFSLLALGATALLARRRN